MGKLIDLAGEKFAMLTVLRRVDNRNGKDLRWLCMCDCGTEIETFGASLRTGRTSSCGCNWPTLQERFDKFTIPEPNSGCLLWLGSNDNNGYGRLFVSEHGRAILATHVALKLAGRPLADGMLACHTCDNPFCVEEKHLFHGTHKDNSDDKINKGRHAHYPAEIKTEAKLLFDAGKGSTEIGRLVGISQACALLWMKEWGHKSKDLSSLVECPKGHPYNDANTYIDAKGVRSCKTCRKANNKKWQEAQHASA